MGKLAYFYQHCENEHCDLGTFNYECPICHRKLVNYDMWGKQWDVYDSESGVVFNCDNCGEKLIVSYERHGCVVEPFK